ncbi:HlyD family efflux transporter periplasmic adaptor subunit [Psychrosphaera haliotis]|uniref:HlyD family efflux transporter periplasmic adaptor subunit n=1 Tax=Psychrosphaera haliotis TaxID=555083 RepID=UPI0031D279D2
MTSKFNYEDHIVSEIVGRQPSWIIRAGIGLLLFVFLTLLSLSAFIEYPDTVSSKITIVSDASPVKLEATRSARIKGLEVKAGERVEKSQNLIILDSNTDYEIIKKLKNDLQTLDIAELKLEALNLGGLQESYNQLQRRVFDFQTYVNRESSSFIGEKSNNLIDAQVTSHTEYQKTLDRMIEEHIFQVSKFNLLIERESVPADVRLPIKQGMLELQSSIEKVTIASKESYILQKELSQKLRDKERQQQDKSAFLTNEIEILRMSLLSLISEWESSNIIKTPVTGIVSFSQTLSTNQYLEKGEEVFSISPLKHTLVGKIQKLDRGLGKVEKGQKVYIELDYFPANEFGQLIGYVSSISMDPDNDEYLVKILLPQQLKTTYGKLIKPAKFYSGNAKIILKEKSLLGRLFNILD